MTDTTQTPLVHYNMSNEVTVATIEALTSLDSLGARRLGDELVMYIGEHPGSKVLLNFQNITYLASAALSELLRVNDVAKETKGVVQLCGLSKDIHRVFEITQLNEVFKINPDEDVEKTILRLDNESEWQVYDS